MPLSRAFYGFAEPADDIFRHGYCGADNNGIRSRTDRITCLLRAVVTPFCDEETAQIRTLRDGRDQGFAVLDPCPYSLTSWCR